MDDDADCAKTTLWYQAKQVSRYKWRLLHLWGACVIGDASTITHCVCVFSQLQVFGTTKCRLSLSTTTTTVVNQTKNKFLLLVVLIENFHVSSESFESVLLRRKRESLQLDIAIPASAPSPPLPLLPQPSSFFHYFPPRRRKKKKGGNF